MVSGLLTTTNRPIQTRFPFGFSFNRFNLAIANNSLAHSSIGTQSSRRTPTPCKPRISESFSLPSRGSFHLSFTVLCSIGVKKYLALRSEPRRFTPDSSFPMLLGIPNSILLISSTGLLPSLVDLSMSFDYPLYTLFRSLNP